MGENQNNIPKHVAIIMDGNGRWAKKRLRPRSMGHKAGVDTVKRIAIHANKLGIKVLTLYAFSTENWGRPEVEVKYLMGLPKLFFKSFMPEIMENDVKLETIGDVSKLPQATLDILLEAKEKTKNNKGLIINVAINYGGKEDIVHAFKSLSQELLAGQVSLDEINQDMIEDRLMTNFLGPLARPDLMIRTSGELRISNFLLWQLAYSEFYFTDVLWPDFKEADFDRAIEAYQSRQRRFGKVIN